MSPYPCSPHHTSVRSTLTRRPPPAIATVAALITALLAVSGCTQVREIGCTSECRTAKEKCDDNARYQYRQCEAGYATAQRDYRWCNSSSAEECGYPWWSCSENLYGYCTNRFNECLLACRRASYPGGYGSRAASY